MKKNTFKIISEEGKEIECEVLFTFDSKETGKSYITYTDHSVDDSGMTQVFAASYNPEEEDGELIPIETEKEWKIIEIILDELKVSAAEREA